jgi:hypothetical protein
MEEQESLLGDMVDEREMRELTFRMDDEIVNDLFEKFPEFKFDDALRNLDEDWMKSKAGKEKWRAFIMPVSPEPKPRLVRLSPFVGHTWKTGKRRGTSGFEKELMIV